MMAMDRPPQVRGKQPTGTTPQRQLRSRYAVTQVKVEMLKLAIHEQGDATILIVSERRPRLRDLWHRHEAR